MLGTTDPALPSSSSKRLGYKCAEYNSARMRFRPLDLLAIVKRYREIDPNFCHGADEHTMPVNIIACVLVQNEFFW